MSAAMPRELDRWLRRIYGPDGDGDRGSWAHSAARAFLAGEDFAEPMPRDRHRVGAGRLEGIRRAVAEYAHEGATP